MIYHRPQQSHLASGNIFMVLFGAVAVVGLLDGQVASVQSAQHNQMVKTVSVLRAAAAAAVIMAPLAAAALQIRQVQVVETADRVGLLSVAARKLEMAKILELPVIRKDLPLILPAVMAHPFKLVGAGPGVDIKAPVVAFGSVINTFLLRLAKPV